MRHAIGKKKYCVSIFELHSFQEDKKPKSEGFLMGDFENLNERLGFVLCL